MQLEVFLGPNALSILGTFAVVRIIAWLAGGPNMLVVVTASVTSGRQAGILTGWGVAFGGFIWACLAVAGVSILFTAFPQLALTLRLSGAVYLFWYGVKSLRRSLIDPSNSKFATLRPATGWRAFRNGFLVTATNPNSAFFYGSILTTFVPVDSPSGLLLAIVLLSGTIGIATYTLTGAFFSMRPIVQFFKSAQRAITAAIGVVFCGFGIGVAWDALRKI